MKKSLSATLAALALTLLFAGAAAAGPKFIAAVNADQIQGNPPEGRGVCTAFVGTPAGFMGVNCTYWNLSSNVTSAWVVWKSENYQLGLCELDTMSGTSGSVSQFCRLPFGPPPWSQSLFNRQLYVVFMTEGYPQGEMTGVFRVAMADGDVDGDGRADPTVFRPATNMSYALSSLNGTIATQQFPGFYWANRRLEADFDGDGMAELASCHIDWDTGEWLWIYTRSSDLTMMQTSWGNEWLNDQEAYGDFDGDARIDVAVFRQDTGGWYIIRSSDGQAQFEQFGAIGDRAVPADYDGDGKADLAVVREEGFRLAWYIRRSSDNSFYRIEWGLSSDTIFPNMPADVDGDGLMDVIVARDVSSEPGTDPDQRYYYALRSSDNTWSVVPWGLATDYARFGDFDGDGRTEFAALRPTDGHLVWFVSPGQSTLMDAFNWGLTGDQ